MPLAVGDSKVIIDEDGLEVNGAIAVSGQEVIDASGNFVGEGVQKFNPLQVALLRWYEANESGATFAVGNGAQGVAYDGANIWVANKNDAIEGHNPWAVANGKGAKRHPITRTKLRHRGVASVHHPHVRPVERGERE